MRRAHDAASPCPVQLFNVTKINTKHIHTWVVSSSFQKEGVVHGDLEVGGPGRLPVGPQVGVEHDVAAFGHPFLE